MANLLGSVINTFTNASVDSLVNGTIDTGLNYTFNSLFNTTYNKNGTEGAIVETVINLVKVSDKVYLKLLCVTRPIDLMMQCANLRVIHTIM